jgi:hypothetical protein
MLDDRSDVLVEQQYSEQAGNRRRDRVHPHEKRAVGERSAQDGLSAFTAKSKAMPSEKKVTNEVKTDREARHTPYSELRLGIDEIVEADKG